MITLVHFSSKSIWFINEKNGCTKQYVAIHTQEAECVHVCSTFHQYVYLLHVWCKWMYQMVCSDSTHRRLNVLMYAVHFTSMSIYFIYDANGCNKRYVAIPHIGGLAPTDYLVCLRLGNFQLSICNLRWHLPLRSRSSFSILRGCVFNPIWILSSNKASTCILLF